MNIFEFYESVGTLELKRLLNKYEGLLESNQLKIENDDIESDFLERLNKDYEIDISLIRTELNRRLWKDEKC
jgi:hypothetical protein